MKLTAAHLLGGAVLLIAGGIAWTATRSAGPLPMPKYTELRPGPLFEHLVTEAELLVPPVFTSQQYPPRVAPAISNVISQGFAPLWQPADPEIAALPAEEPW